MQIEQLDGGKTEIADAAFEELRTAFRGSLIAAGDDKFDRPSEVDAASTELPICDVRRCCATASQLDISALLKQRRRTFTSYHHPMIPITTLR